MYAFGAVGRRRAGPAGLFQIEHALPPAAQRGARLAALALHPTPPVQPHPEPLALEQVDGVARAHAPDVGHGALGRVHPRQVDGLGARGGPAPHRGAGAAGAAPVAVGRHAEVAQHVVGSHDVARLHLGHHRRRRVAGVVDAQLYVARHHALGYVVEHQAAHAAARCGQPRLAYAHYAAVAGLVGGEVACKAQPVVNGAAVVSGRPLRHLGRARLAGHAEKPRPGLLAKALAHHVLEHRLQRAHRLRLAYSLLLHHGRELHDGLAVLHHLLHKPRPHHLAVVGYGVVERHGVYRSHLCLVAYAHPRQRRLAPVEPLAALVLLGHAYDWLGVAHERYVQVVGYARAVEPLDVLLGVVVVETVYHVAHPDVAAHLERPGHVDVLVAPAAPVVVFHEAPVHVHHAAAGVYYREKN